MSMHEIFYHAACCIHCVWLIGASHEVRGCGCVASKHAVLLRQARADRAEERAGDAET
jgi:hypothetical protein